MTKKTQSKTPKPTIASLTAKNAELEEELVKLNQKYDAQVTAHVATTKYKIYWSNMYSKYFDLYIEKKRELESSLCFKFTFWLQSTFPSVFK